MRFSVNAFSNTVWQIQFTSRLFLSSFFFRQISKKHLNERQILAIQYISRGVLPTFAIEVKIIACGPGRGSFSYQISLQDFEECENNFSHVQKTEKRKKRKKPFIFLQCTISIGFFGREPLFCHWFTTTR